MTSSNHPDAVDWTTLLAHPDLVTLIELALREDIGAGDVTTDAIFTTPQRVAGRIVTRHVSVVCGLPLAQALLSRQDPTATYDQVAPEGKELPAKATLLAFEADVRAVLTLERTLLNFMMRLCGVASAARLAVAALPEGARSRIYDTRKTTPGWRLLDKAAVRTGGAENHRIGLFDAVLIKDNHVAAAGSVARAVAMTRAHVGRLPIEAGIDRLEQLEEAINAGADIVLLDNMSCEEMRQAVELARGRVELEASGGITLQRIPEIARTGVDRISLGALTHTVRPADLSLEIDAASARLEPRSR